MTSYILKNLRRDLHKRAPIDGERGFHMLPDGQEVADIELTVDMESLSRRLGIRAMKNKTGRATFAWGYITAKVTLRKRVAL